MDKELKAILILSLIIVLMGFCWWIGFHEALHDNGFVNWLDNT